MEDVNSCNINPLSSSKEELKAKIIGLRKKKKKKKLEKRYLVFSLVCFCFNLKHAQQY